jgi:hypothetical protein
MIKCPQCGAPHDDMEPEWTLLACNKCVEEWAGLDPEEMKRREFATIGIGGAWPSTVDEK